MNNDTDVQRCVKDELKWEPGIGDSAKIGVSVKNSVVTVPHGTRYCGAECEAKGEMPEIDCKCGHPQCKGTYE